VHIFAKSINKFLERYLLTDSNCLKVAEEGAYFMIHCFGYILFDKSLEVNRIDPFMHLIRTKIIENCLESNFAWDYDVFDFMQEILN